MFNLLGIFAQLAAGNQYILLVIVPVMIIYFFLQRFYRKTSIEIQRQEALSRAPILSHLSTSLEGAATIRSYDMEKQFKTAIMNKIDLNTVDFYGLRYCAMWFGLRLDWCGNAIILATYLAIALTRNYGTIDPGTTDYFVFASSTVF
jgi:ABC-type multidrug transport system fused ATPase/permease subunit